MKAVLSGVWNFSFQVHGLLFKNVLKRLILLFSPQTGVQKVFLRLFY